MNYEQCLKYLQQIQNLGVKFGLDNVRAVLASLHNPHQRYPSILVAGTNGKGSVCAMLVRILSLHGYSVGLFTSPHLVHVEERVRIGEKLISRRSLAKSVTILREKIESLLAAKELLAPPTYFELMSCLAFLYFCEQNVDVAVLEVGMGGRFDATNVVNPVISVITTISPEHQNFLGETPGQIAFEKAGIIKPGVSIVSGVKNKEASRTIKQRALELDAPLIDVFSMGKFLINKKEKGRLTFEYISSKERYVYSPSLLGEHQGRNAAVAIAASERLSLEWRNLEKNKIIQGVETARWPGRLEVIKEKPLLILDAAHNEEGAKALKKYIVEFISPPLTLVFAIMRDKKIERVADILFPLAKEIILTCFPYYRAASPEEIRQRAARFQGRIVLEPDVKKAVRLALQKSGPQGAVLAAGSLFLVGEIKKIFGRSGL